MQIGELSRRAGISTATIRYYERRGLLGRPERTSAGYRLYPAETALQLRMIRWAQTVGFTLREIRDLLAVVREHAQQPTGRVRRRFQEKLDEVEARLRELTAIRDQLAALADCRCRGTCPILERATAEPALPTPRTRRTRP